VKQLGMPDFGEKKYLLFPEAEGILGSLME
jgi:hypothetical protein